MIENDPEFSRYVMKLNLTVVNLIGTIATTGPMKITTGTGPLTVDQNRWSFMICVA